MKNLIIVGAGIIMGVFSACLAWLIRRPDKDVKPLPLNLIEVLMGEYIPSPRLRGEGGPKGRVRGRLIDKPLTPTLSP